MWQEKRSEEKEMMDYGLEFTTPQEYNDALKKLSTINTFLGGFKPIRKAISQFKNTRSILEIGCGGGYLAQYLHRYFEEAHIVGIDIDSKAVNHALKHLPDEYKSKVSFHLQRDTHLEYPDNSFDIVTTILVCHHMTDDEIVLFLRESYRVASKAVIINDLQRHFLAYLSFFLIGKLFRNNLIWSDGRLSIKRSFIRKEWEQLLKKAGFQKSQYTLQWNFPFRFTLILRKS